MWKRWFLANEDAFSTPSPSAPAPLWLKPPRSLYTPPCDELTLAASRIRPLLSDFSQSRDRRARRLKSADGRRHDYWFTFINGDGGRLGLGRRRAAHGLMDRLLGKMPRSASDRFELGLARQNPRAHPA